MLMYASTNSSQVFTDPTSNKSNHVVVVSLSENGKSCNLITSGLTPFSFIVLVILINLPMCSLGSSDGWPVNWFCCTMVISAIFSSKLFA